MKIISYILLFFLCSACVAQEGKSEKSGNIRKSSAKSEVKTNAVAYFASGCFWCVEAVFESVKGVGDVVSGYAGGKEKNPTYEEVSAGITGHAETVEVPYDSNVVDYKTLLKVFYGSHNPETLNQQGPDRGTQYRSAIFYQNETEKKWAEEYVQKLLRDKTFSRITTEIAPLQKFYPAEEYHQDFERRNPNQSYVQAVSIPRLRAFQKRFPELLKDEMDH